MGRPVIGISGYCDQARWDIWDCPATVIQQTYVHGISEHGGRAVVLPPDEVDADVLDRLDGLVLSSGPDIDPGLYGRPPHPETEEPKKDRDVAEMLLVHRALETGLPVLGICRGLQLMALATGGSLHQHLPDVLGHSGHCPEIGVLAEHEVRFAPNSVARSLLGERAVVNSHHHQGIDDPGDLRVTGRASDGSVEAAELPGRRFAFGVQWHPEVAGGDGLFAAFVLACAATPAHA